MNPGIDAFAFDVAPLHLPISSLAAQRTIEAEKLEKGLGLLKMTLPDVYQDPVVFGANALTKLIEQNQVNLSEVARIYVGTESSIDSSKPIASFLIQLMEQKFGENCLAHCDIVDLTFACIGGVDAMQNCLDFVRINPSQKAIVVTTDIAKYDLESTGEYTQGAGATAILISAHPRIISFNAIWATSSKGVFDFFKPYRNLPKKEITGNDHNESWMGQLEAEIEIHKEQPIFDGQYSNQSYMDRTKAAYFAYKSQTGISGCLYANWSQIIMHLPYAFQGRRMLSEIYALDAITPLLSGTDAASDYQNKLKEVSKSEAYKQFVADKLQDAEQASSRIGNLYTGSIFMGLLSALTQAQLRGDKIIEQKFGFMAYGSGSKSKVFEGIIQADWHSQIEKSGLFSVLANSQEIDFSTYEKLHKKEQKTAVRKPKHEWVLDRIETQIPNLIGARYYKWID